MTKTNTAVAERRNPASDFIVTNHGSIYLIMPLNKESEEHLRSHCADAQWFGSQLVVEHRFVSEVVFQLRAEGFSVE